MTVKELLEKLQSCDPEAEVFTYSQIDEGGDSTSKVLLGEQARKTLYFKSAAPWYEFENEDNNFVVIA